MLWHSGIYRLSENKKWRVRTYSGAWLHKEPLTELTNTMVQVTLKNIFVGFLNMCERAHRKTIGWPRKVAQRINSLHSFWLPAMRPRRLDFPRWRLSGSRKFLPSPFCCIHQPMRNKGNGKLKFYGNPHAVVHDVQCECSSLIFGEEKILGVTR